MNNYASLVQRFDREKFLSLNEEISFSEYIDRVWDNPRLIRTAYQRMYDMIMHKGSSEFTRYRKTLTHYHFFDDAEIPIFGLDETLNNLVKFVKGRGYFLLEHNWTGKELIESYAKAVLSSIRCLWDDVVLLSSRNKDGEEIVFISDSSKEEEVEIVSREVFEKNWFS